MVKNTTNPMGSQLLWFSFAASLSSIVALLGWGLEKFSDIAPGALGIFASTVVVLTFFSSIALLIVSFRKYESVKALKGDDKLNHRITHQLRNAITKMQELEFSTTDNIAAADSVGQFQHILENDALKRKEIFKTLCAKITTAVANQVEAHFRLNGLVGNVRVTVKSIVPTASDQTQWYVITSGVDSNTYSNQDKDIHTEEIDPESLPTIGENSDFLGILTGKVVAFSENDLSSLSHKEYKNSSPDWRSKYNATLVVPIKNQPEGKSNSVYYGFLSADSLNPKKQQLFGSDDESPTLHIVAHAADALAVWYIKNDNHEKVVNQRQVEREAELAISEFIEKRNKSNQQDQVA